MKISLNWLRDFVNIDTPINELEEKISKQSTEVTNILYQERKYKNIVIGQILKLRPHKNADKLQIATINIGNKKIQVACSAKNIAEGQIVPVGLEGAIVPSTYKTKDEFQIKSMDFRGELSEGMMCSERELDIGDDHSGIMILSQELTPGQTLSEALELNDIVLDVDFQSNQGYCMSHVGMAREIAALLDIPMNWQPTDVNLPTDETENELKIEITDEKLCPRYSGIIMEGIETKPSPLWMQNRLRAAGMRPINNIVDVTNYVLLELGQPMHAFDYEKIAKKDGVPTIIVRKSVKGEQIKTLDEKDHILPEDVLLISDVEKPVAVAGIMGGANSEIDEKTTKIVLESANFDAITLRKGAKKLATRTDAVARYEKNLDPNLTMIGLKRAVELLLEITNGRVVSKVVDVYPNPVKPIKLNLSYKKTNRVLGIEIDKEIQKRNLQNLGFEVEQQADQIIVTVPTIRTDIKRSIDLVEEIIRIYGYDNVPLEFPLVPQKPANVDPKAQLIKDLQNLMTGMGFYEIQSYSMIGEKLIKDCNFEIGSHIKIINPQSPEKEYMRMSLLPSLIYHTKENQKVKQDIKHFEIQKIYIKNSHYNQEDRLDQYAFEPQQLTAVWSCISSPDKGRSREATEGFGFYAAKGIVEAILENLNIKNIEYVENNNEVLASKTFHPTHSAIIKCHSDKEEDPVIIGIVGELHPKVIEKMGLEENTIAFELDVVTLLKLKPKEMLFKQFSKYQVVSQDLSLLVNEDVTFIDIIKTITNNNFNSLVKRVEAKDQYKGKGIPEGKKSLTINVQMQSDDHTLEQEEIEQARQNLLKAIEKEVGGKLR